MSRIHILIALALIATALVPGAVLAISLVAIALVAPLTLAIVSDARAPIRTVRAPFRSLNTLRAPPALLA